MSDLDKIDLKRATDQQLAEMLTTMATSIERLGEQTFVLPIRVIREASRRLGAPPLPSKENQE